MATLYSCLITAAVVLIGIVKGDSAVIDNGCAYGIDSSAQCSLTLLSPDETQAEDCAAFSNSTLQCKIGKTLREFDVDARSFFMHVYNETLLVMSTSNKTVFKWTASDNNARGHGGLSMHAESVWSNRDNTGGSATVNSGGTQETPKRRLLEWRCVCQILNGRLKAA